MEAAFSYSGNSKWVFCLVETVSFGQCYFTANRNHCWNKEKTVLRERAHSCKWSTDFLASGNHFFLHFSGTPARKSVSVS